MTSEAIVITEHLIKCLDQDEAVVNRDELEVILKALKEATVQAGPA